MEPLWRGIVWYTLLKIDFLLQVTFFSNPLTFIGRKGTISTLNSNDHNLASMWLIFSFKMFTIVAIIPREGYPSILKQC